MGKHGKISPCLMENLGKYGTTLGHTIGTVRPLILKTMGYAVAIFDEHDDKPWNCGAQKLFEDKAI